MQSEGLRAWDHLPGAGTSKKFGNQRQALAGEPAANPSGGVVSEQRVTIITASSQVDAPFVLSMQFMRVIVVLAMGPWMARLLAGRNADPRSAPTSR